MPAVTMMAFFMLCCERLRLKGVASLVWVLGLGISSAAPAQSTTPVAPSLQLERQADAVLLSTQLAFDVPRVVVEALEKGIPVYFVMRAKLLRERWYWTNETVAQTQRHTRLSYHPLTRRWRLSTVASEAAETGQGLSLDQHFDTLADALSAIRRVSGWRIADGVSLSADSNYLVDFKFELDTTQLPRPLQIGTLGQADWRIAVGLVQALPRATP